MKTSKIIFISFFSMLGLFLMSLLIDIPQDPKLFGHEHALPSFSHLVIKGKPTVNVVLASQLAKNDSLSFYFTKDDCSSNGLYQTKGDTLLIDVENCDNLNHVILKCLKLPDITANNASLFLSGDTAMNIRDTVSIVGTSSFVGINNMCSDLKMNLSFNDKSILDCQSKNIATVNISLNSSNAFFYDLSIGNLTGVLSNGSILNVSSATHLNITSDNSSKFEAYPN